jgi:hypothetical protein
MLWQSTSRSSPRDSQKCGGSMLGSSTAARQSAKPFIPGIPLNNELFQIPAIRSELRPSRTHPTAFFLARLDGLTRTRYSLELALDLLYGCGMMPESDGHLLIGREVRGHSSSLVTAGALKNSVAASFPFSLPKILSAFSLFYQRKIKFPLVNLFGGTLRLNERLGCHDPFMSGHASR